jgi:hypothetical protein
MQLLHHILQLGRNCGATLMSSALNRTVHLQLSLCLSFYLRRSLGGYTVGTTARFLVEIVEALAPQISPLNPAEVPAVAYEHLFHLRR